VLNRLIWSLGPLLEVRDAPRAALDPSRAEVMAEVSRMRADPKPLARPVVVLAGYRAWSIMPRSVAATLAKLTTGRPWPEDFLAIAYPWSTRLEAIAGRVADAAERRWPGQTVDVVAVSMGGLVARTAAAGLTPDGRRLRIARLFSLATPHRGARLAAWVRPDAAARAMRPGSAFLARLDDCLAADRARGMGYALVCYARLRDSWVGARRTSPAGVPVAWVHGWRLLSHLAISSDMRILTDIARRLRGEEPWPRWDVEIPRD
jgi:hypothetical protein